jgi:cyclase
VIKDLELVMNTVRFWTLIPLAFLPALGQAIDIDNIAPDVWLALQPDERKFNDCNTLIVAARDFVIIVDAQESAGDVNQIIQFVQSQIKKPVRYLINTHWHSDHTQGNTIYKDAYGDELIIVGHETHADDIENRAAAYVRDRVNRLKEQLPAALAQLESGIKRDGSKFTDEELAAQTIVVHNAEAWIIANDGIEFTLPTLRIDDVYSVEAGAASFSIHPMRGHTRGDLVIHFSQLGLVATGDLVDEMPYTGHGYPGEWLVSLGSIKDFAAETYLTGHGAAQINDVLIDKLLVYFESLTSQVKSLLADGNTAEQIKASIDLSHSRVLLAGDDEKAARFFDRVQEDAIDRAIKELVTSEKQQDVSLQ